MKDPFVIISLISATIIALIAGWVIARQRAVRQISKLMLTNAKLTSTLDAERRSSSEKFDAIAQMRDELTNTFTNLSDQALKIHSEELLKLTKETIDKEQSLDLDELRLQPIDHLLKPIQHALDETNKHIDDIAIERKEIYDTLNKHLTLIASTQKLLHDDAKDLIDSMQNPGKREEWSRRALGGLAELAGMAEHCEFLKTDDKSSEAQNSAGQEGDGVPDMMINIPEDRHLMVEATVPLDAYISIIDAVEESVRSWQLERHARSLHDRIREISAFSYWRKFKNSPEFIVLLIPGEQYLTMALDVDPELLGYALEKKVILATPTNLISILRVVAYGWRHEALSRDITLFRELGEDLFKRLSVITQHLSTLSTSLNRSMDSDAKRTEALKRDELSDVSGLGEDTSQKVSNIRG